MISRRAGLCNQILTEPAGNLESLFRPVFHPFFPNRVALAGVKRLQPCAERHIDTVIELFLCALDIAICIGIAAAGCKDKVFRQLTDLIGHLITEANRRGDAVRPRFTEFCQKVQVERESSNVSAAKKSLSPYCTDAI